MSEKCQKNCVGIPLLEYLYASSQKPASHCPITKESGGTQSAVKPDEICSDCFGPTARQLGRISQ